MRKFSIIQMWYDALYIYDRTEKPADYFLRASQLASPVFWKNPVWKIALQHCGYFDSTKKCIGVSNMLLVLSIAFYFHYNIWGCMCSTGPFKLGDWNDMSVAHVIIIIKSEVSTFPIVFIFFRGCVPEMLVTSYSATYCIYIPGKVAICFHLYCAVYGECK